MFLIMKDCIFRDMLVIYTFFGLYSPFLHKNASALVIENEGREGLPSTPSNLRSIAKKLELCIMRFHDVFKFMLAY